MTFGRDGLALEWVVYTSVAASGLDCPDVHSARIDGSHVFYGLGIHGGSAWRCVTAGAVGNARPLAFELWYDIRLHSPAMRRRAMRMVATARLVP